MYQIDDLTKWFGEYTQDVIKKLVEGQDKIAAELENDVKQRAFVPSEATRNPGQFSKYISSIKKSPTSYDGHAISTTVGSDLVVNDGSKWDGVPIGAFLEWGTGELGYTTNQFQHGFPYTLTGPWDLATYEQWFYTNTYGIPAVPHFHPAIMHIKPKWEKMIEEAIHGH